MRGLAWAVLAAALVVSGWYLAATLSGNWYPDYLVFWTAAQVSGPYGSHALTQAQAWMTRPEWGLRPFSYPPSAILMFKPLSLLPFWPSYVVWVGATATLFWFASRPIVSGRWLLLVFAMPPVLVTMISGQTALLIGAALIFGTINLKPRPVLAGLVMGLATAIKPQAFILAPLTLIVARQWTALAGFIAGGAAMVAGSLLLGPGLWLDWFVNLDDFAAIIQDHGLGQHIITPTGVAATLGLSALPFQIVGAALGIFVVWRAFRRDDVNDRIVALAGGSLLCSPYAMLYDMTALVPVMVAAIAASRPIGGLPLVSTGAAFTLPLMLLARLRSSI